MLSLRISDPRTVGRCPEDEDGQASPLRSRHHGDIYDSAHCGRGRGRRAAEASARDFQPLPKHMATAEFPITRERVELGRSLFFDPRLPDEKAVIDRLVRIPGYAPLFKAAFPDEPQPDVAEYRHSGRRL